LFKRLKYEVPKYYHKVSGVAGDCSLPGLGLSASSRNTLIKEVNIIFHGAATVRFDEHIRVAMDINVSGTRELINLAKTITNLKVTLKYGIHKYIIYNNNLYFIDYRSSRYLYGSIIYTI